MGKIAQEVSGLTVSENTGGNFPINSTNHNASASNISESNVSEKTEKVTLNDFENLNKVQNRSSFEQFFGHLPCDKTLSARQLFDALGCRMVTNKINVTHRDIFFNGELLLADANYYQCLALGRLLTCFDAELEALH